MGLKHIQLSGFDKIISSETKYLIKAFVYVIIVTEVSSIQCRALSFSS